MNLQALATILFAALVSCATATVDHDKIKPFPQPEPITVSEKAAVKFKPQLTRYEILCASYPAVNAAGEVTGGLKGSNGNDACENAPLGSQVYGRAGWYKDLWAIMYSWYFPKEFFMAIPTKRHDWQSVVIWISNPEVETPKIVGVSMSMSKSKYAKQLQLSPSSFAGYRSKSVRYGRTYQNEVLAYGSNTTLRFAYTIIFGSAFMTFSNSDGDFQDLIMWEQLTDAARAALNDNNNFGSAEVPFNDDHYESRLEKAYPL
ncbi:hypothetical protein PHMEG_00019894 [Phytophthora megakarya]|uniref:Necrosis inducing protein NPP1 n=1 Tax=Phytophthora megakarya TaxID=4795 RepID=A0A225VRC8_9STRA|nr:hypothetical protein PHMEG_00019894 [Phytophthora megakarya]